MAEPFFDHQEFIDFVVNKGNGAKGLSQMSLKTIPEIYIQPPEERADQIQVAEAKKSIPTIDVSKWDEPKVSDSICRAAAEFGFFQIINHGIPIEVLDNVKQAAHDFFDLPVEERRQYLGENSPTPSVQLVTSHSPSFDRVFEWKDYLIHYYYAKEDENQNSKLWPPVSRDQVLEYIKWTKPVIKKLLNVLLKGISTKEIDETNESILMGKLVVDFLYYPICPNPELATGVGRHSDVSLITVLLQDDVGGLYVREPEGNGWIHVTPVKGALVVNIGDVLQIMSNDKYKSIEHRVIANGTKNRVSVPIFVNPVPDAVIGPVPEVLEGGVKPIYKKVVYSNYFDYFFGKGHDGKATIEYAKI